MATSPKRNFSPAPTSIVEKDKREKKAKREHKELGELDTTPHSIPPGLNPNTSPTSTFSTEKRKNEEKKEKKAKRERKESLEPNDQTHPTPPSSTPTTVRMLRRTRLAIS